MEQYAIVFQVLGVLLVLFFGFVTYMNTKTWRWVHVTFLFLVFAAVPVFGVYAALTIKTRKAWMTLVQKQTKDLEAAQARVKLLQRGEANDIKAEKDSIYARSEELSRLILDRGRVWRNCRPGGIANGTITLQVPVVAAVAQPAPAPAPMPMPMPVDPAAPAADPMDPAAAQPAPAPAPEPAPAAVGGGHSIAKKMVLYAFQEVDGGQGFAVPQFYLGEFMVVDTGGDSITIAPLMKLAADQEARATNGRDANGNPLNWMLYETCPIDTHEIFAGLTAEQISQFIPIAETGLGPEAYAALINTYVQDGQRAAEGTAPDNLWAEVKFVKAYKEEVDAAPNPANNFPGVDLFDKDGKAQPARLHRKETDLAEFEAGDTAIIPNERAEELVTQGIVEKIQPIYRRTIIDYAARLTSLNRRFLEIDGNIREVTRDIATIQAANVKAEEQITLETEHKRQVTEDLAKVNFERDGVASYGSTLFGKLTQTNTEIRQLYASNKALNVELQQLTAKATDEANRRTREATAAATR